MNDKYFYQFLEPLSNELALLAKELENSVFSSPRTMLTHSRVFIESILKKVMNIENLEETPKMGILDRINALYKEGDLSQEVLESLHHIRIIGNQASHDSRIFRYSESLLSWEALYKVVKWYVESYGPINIDVPDYQEPSFPQGGPLDLEELIERLKLLEDALTAPKTSTGQPGHKEAATTKEGTNNSGYTPVRRISYLGEHLNIPHFLRDTFLLPQRFQKSETFLIRLGEVQQARFMSELPNNLVNLHKHVKRYNENNDKTFFEELRLFVEEETTRKEISESRRGELLFFYKSDYIVVTEELTTIPLTSEEFSGIPSLLKQLKQNEILTVGQLPKELVSLAKYTNVGIGTVEKLFNQVKMKQLVMN
jgi:hypothetical protein